MMFITWKSSFKQNQFLKPYRMTVVPKIQNLVIPLVGVCAELLSSSCNWTSCSDLRTRLLGGKVNWSKASEFNNGWLGPCFTSLLLMW